MAGVPFYQEAYGGEDGFRRAGQSLLPAPSMATHNGLIFISGDPDAPPLADYLGDFAFYLDFYTRQSPAGIELRGPQRWRIKANWKIGAENFAGDSYHTPHTHASVVDIGLFREPKASQRIKGALYIAGPGSGTTYKLPPAGNGHSDFADQLRYVGYPDSMIAGMAAAWSDRQRALVAGSGFMVSAATLFPNLSFVHNWPQIDAAGTVVPFISLRQWQPVSERETEVLSWFAVDAAAPEDFKRQSYQAYLMCFGSSGMFEQDDVENWVSITDMAAGDGAAAEPQQPDGADLRGQAAQAAYRGLRRARRGLPGFRRVRPAALAEPVERSPLPGGPVTAARPLRYGDPAHLAAHQFLVEEAALLDAADYAGWLELLCEDIRYVMPVRVTTARGAGFDSLSDMAHFDEDMYALRKRVQRLATDHAWTEDPPSRTRHFVTNVRTFRAAPGELRVQSALLLFRSRGDTREADLLSAGRADLLRETADGLRLARREITADESVLRTQNLAVFL